MPLLDQELVLELVGVIWECTLIGEITDIGYIYESYIKACGHMYVRCKIKLVNVYRTTVRIAGGE
jgi:hypothetical protein